jgi:uridine kinase
MMDDIFHARHGRQDNKPLLIGMGGGTGSGKTTIAKEIQSRLQPLSVKIINQDRFFKPVDELPTFYSEYHQRPYPDFNRPDSFKTDEMFDYCRGLTDSIGDDLLILEGILVLYYPQLRRLFDIKCYVSLALEEMLIRRTQRNLAAGYGGDFAEISHYNLECVTPQHLRYNAPTERHADLVIPNGPDDEQRKEELLAALCLQIRGL